MEVSVLGHGFQSLLPRRFPFPPPSSPSSSSSSTRGLIISRLFCYATSTFVNGEVAATQTQKRHSKSYLARQSAIREVQQSSDCRSALSRLEGVLKVQDLNAILRHFGTRKRWHDLSQIFDWMQQNGKISASSYSSYIKFLGESLNPMEALEIYSSIQDESIKSNVFVCNSVLGSLIRNGKFDGGFKLFHQMKQDGLTPDIITYSTLLAGCIKAKQSYPTSVELVQELRHNGLQMDSVIYGTILAICASNNKWEEAERYFNQMKDEGHPPNEFHYSSLLNAYSICGNYKKAEILVQDMKSAGLVPNKVILTTLLKAYVRGGLFEKSKELLAELEALGYAEDEMPYCLLMDALAKDGQINEAKLVFDELQKKCVRSDGYAYSIMISAFCRGRRFEEAKQLAKDFEATYDRYDLVMLNTMICAYCRAGEMESVMEMLKKMDELAISPDYKTFHILIKYFCKEKLYLLAHRTMVDMHNKGHQLEEELGKLKYFLRIEMAYSRQGIFVSQQKYVTDLLIETEKADCKPAATPMDSNQKLSEAREEPPVDKGMYQRLVGRLIYLTHTRLDIAYSVSVISQFMHDPREPHLQAAHRILHYLKGNLGKGILFKKNSTLTLEAYTDADYAGSIVDRRSTTGYCTFLGGNLITWRSKKQNVVARSSAEAEFRGVAQGMCELLWLKIILDDLRVKWEEPMKLYCDKKSAINITHNPIQHDRTKHIEIDRHFIRRSWKNDSYVCLMFLREVNWLMF
ncbi:hypothetical protein L484_009995 [Morus notabilis]|uniref:PROP1-like PPR domain-containing protein n=1 Tax=Morus notabilis TaxID=981085 RepID=W9QQN5_9ROSA|nr:hypothetical protein L484_009995 [Morus notabilis]